MLREKKGFVPNLLTALHTFVSTPIWWPIIYQRARTDLAAVCGKTRPLLVIWEISEWTSTSLYQEEPRPPCRVEPLFVFSPEDPVVDQRQQRSSGVSIITSLWWPSHSLFRQASHMYMSHANVKHVQTHSTVRRVLQIKHFATCASHQHMNTEVKVWGTNRTTIITDLTNMSALCSNIWSSKYH